MGGAVKAVATVVSTAMAGPIGTYASLAMTGYSMLQQRRQAKKAAKASKAAAEEQRKQEEAKQRYNEVQAQRQRVEQQRQARIRSGQILAQMGSSGLGMTGTAGYIGSMGSVGSQLNRNISDINMGVGYGQAVGESNQRIAGYQQKGIEAEASMAGWKQVQDLAGSFGGTFGNIFDTSNQQMKSSSGPKLSSGNIFSGGQIGPSFMRSK
ncbi:hypothetical protein MTPG_00018 [Methylophilales phage HIM624-A]|nr:hypothetical protein MTPG_00018 [Methylophilales phage HIM624-A]